MLSLKDATLSRGNKILLNQANLQLHEKQKIGLIGHNGCGKSSLFSLLLGKLMTDSGECFINPQLRISHLSQELPDSPEPAVDFVLSGDTDYTTLIERLAKAEASGDDAAVLACHEALSNSGGYSKPAEAAVIMSGLGFSSEEQKAAVNSFSGGWRMRLSLARCLMKPADLLLLDEPTNHLDMEAIFWLERWLKLSPASIILISHDREFLDAFVTHILHIDNQTSTLYSGNYSIFEKTRAQQLALQQAMYVRQQSKIAHMMSFVNRFKAKATKARQAQGRLKVIEKMELVAQAQLDSPFTFEFYPCKRAGNPLLQCEKISAGYDSNSIILKDINLSLNPGDRIALLGPNGQGKSTLIKTLTGSLKPIAGEIHRSAHLHIGYYAQHQLETLDCNLSPVQTIQKISTDAREQEIRDFLGGFNFMGDMAMTAIEHFSGGEKARLALAKLVWLKPNLLLLDEPTNHLDLGMRSAIEIALQSYEGAVILVSHDRHMLKSSVDDFFLVYDQTVSPFKGELDDYYQWLQNKEQGKRNTSANPPSKNAYEYKEKKALQNRFNRLEKDIEECQKKLAKIDLCLADPGLYEMPQEVRRKQLLEDRADLQDKLLHKEEEWLEIAEMLE